MMTKSAFFASKGDRGQGHDSSLGKSQELPLPELPGTPVSYPLGTTLHQLPENLGGCSGAM